MTSREITVARKALKNLAPGMRFKLHLTNPAHKYGTDYRTLVIDVNRTILEARGVTVKDVRRYVVDSLDSLPFTTVEHVSVKQHTPYTPPVNQEKVDTLIEDLLTTVDNKDYIRKVIHTITPKLSQVDRNLMFEVLRKL